MAANNTNQIKSKKRVADHGKFHFRTRSQRDARFGQARQSELTASGACLRRWQLSQRDSKTQAGGGKNRYGSNPADYEKYSVIA